MEITVLLPWLSAVSMLISIGTAVTLFFTSGAKQNEKKLVDHDRRIQTIEGELRHLPNKDTIAELQLGIAELKGTVNLLGERLNPIASTSARLQEFLLEQAKK